MRLKIHNLGKVKPTKHYRPFHMVFTEEVGNKEEAGKREINLNLSLICHSFASLPISLHEVNIFLLIFRISLKSFQILLRATGFS